MAVIAVFNQKGGVGKTTTTLNVAASLALLERKPIVIDLDPQAHVSLALGVRNPQSNATTGRLLSRQGAAGPASPVALATDSPAAGPSPTCPRSMPCWALRAGVAGTLKRGLDASLAWDDAPILIDCAPALGVLSLNALFAADRVLIPVTADFLAIQGLNRLDLALNVLEGPAEAAHPAPRCADPLRREPSRNAGKPWPA
jgi:chromosome partitioning protein